MGRFDSIAPPLQLERTEMDNVSIVHTDKSHQKWIAFPLALSRKSKVKTLPLFTSVSYQELRGTTGNISLAMNLLGNKGETPDKVNKFGKLMLCIKRPLGLPVNLD